ncbi:MAG: hypothetical protein IPH48_01165 [bacterium]|nr:hypothetical protein [bacterium]
MSRALTRCRRPHPGAAVITTLALCVAVAVPAAAADALIAPLHGGTVTETEAHVFEAAIARDGIHVWFHTDERAPAMIGRAGGSATLRLPDGKVQEVALSLRTPAADDPGVFFCPMHAEVVQTTPGKCEPCGGMILYHQDELFGAFDLSKVELSKVTAQVRVTGLKGRQKEATFSPVFPRPDGKAEAAAQGR